MKISKSDIANIFNINLPDGKFKSDNISDTMSHMFNDLVNQHMADYPDYDIYDTDDYVGEADDKFLKILDKVALAGGFNDFRVFFNMNENKPELIPRFSDYIDEHNEYNELIGDFVKSISDSSDGVVDDWHLDDGGTLHIAFMDGDSKEYDSDQLTQLIDDFRDTGSIPSH